MDNPIKTNKQLHEAIKQADFLRLAPSGTPDLVGITKLQGDIDAYLAAKKEQTEEDRFTPTTLRGLLELEMFTRKLTGRQMAKLLGIHETRLSEHVRGKRKFNWPLVKKMHAILEIPAYLLLQLEN